METASIEFAISVFIVHLFHIGKRWIPWLVGAELDALKVVSVVVAVMSSVVLTFTVQRQSEVIQIGITIGPLPVLVRLAINGLVQHGMSQIYYAALQNLRKSEPGGVTYTGPRPSMAGPILPSITPATGR